MTIETVIAAIHVRREITPCRKCQHPIELDADQRRNLEDHDMAKIVCPECANTAIIYPPDTKETTAPIERQVTLTNE